MPNRRRQSKHSRPHRPLGAHHPSAVTKADGDWLVRGIPASAAVKQYVCPGCGGGILPGVAHLVVWPRLPSIGASVAMDERRHWHKHCWARRR